MKYRKKPVVIEAWLTEVISFLAEKDWHRLPEYIK